MESFPDLVAERRARALALIQSRYLVVRGQTTPEQHSQLLTEAALTGDATEALLLADAVAHIAAELVDTLRAFGSAVTDQPMSADEVFEVYGRDYGFPNA
jgi:hypothetical protein